MLSTEMTGEAYDFLQNILENDTQDYVKIKALFQENFHGDEDVDFYRDKFDEIQRTQKSFHFQKTCCSYSEICKKSSIGTN